MLFFDTLLVYDLWSVETASITDLTFAKIRKPKFKKRETSSALDDLKWTSPPGILDQSWHKGRGTLTTSIIAKRHWRTGCFKA